MSPALSVIMVTLQSYQTCRTTISYLRQQTVVDQIELIIVAPSRQGLDLVEPDLAPFHSYQVVDVGEVSSTGGAMAAGVFAAHAPIVAYGEQHSYPEPDWAEHLLAAHRGPYAAVGCAIGNANPKTLASWAHLYGQFSGIVDPVVSHETPHLGGHHVVYKRDRLLAYGDLLEQMLENECALYLDLHEKGERLYLCGEAVSNHVNISKPLTYLYLDYLGQRGFATARARAGQWSVWRKALYVAATPLIPLVRLARILRDIVRTRRARQLLPGVVLIILPALMCGAVGEAMGYLFGDKEEIARQRAPVELDRYRYVVETDRLQQRAQRGSREKLLAILAKAPDIEPSLDDKLPD